MLLAFVFALLVQTSLLASACNDGCCDGKCWEKCFNNFIDGNYANSYKDAASRIYQAVEGIRALHGPCSKPHGTVYMLDSDLPPSISTTMTPAHVHKYQRILASIVSIAQPVSNQCNPFFVNKYHRFWAWYAWSWDCKDRCQAATVLSSSSMQTFTISPDAAPGTWLGGGCILANNAVNNPGLSCSADTENELQIAFTNSQFFSHSTCALHKRAVIGTNPATPAAAAAAWADPGPFYHLPADIVHYGVSHKILNCMNQECCPNHSPNHFPLRKRRQSGNETTDGMLRSLDTPTKFGYSTSDMDGVREFKGTFEKFKEEVLDKFSDSTVHTDEDYPNGGIKPPKKG